MINTSHIKRLAIVMMAIGSLGLTGCGFALRGSANQTLQIAPAYRQVSLELEDTQTAFALKTPLYQELKLMGINPQSGNNHINITNVRFARYELVGTLTEVRLVLTADVSYTLNGQTLRANPQVQQSYQYNEASVVTLDQQGEKVKTWLYDELAKRIAEQYRAYAISTP